MRVLVVEDSRSLADVVAEGLRDQGMAVDVADDGSRQSSRSTSMHMTWSCSTATSQGSTATPSAP